MGLLAQATDYTSKDVDSLRLRLQSLVRSVFPDWTDFNVASFGNILLELYAFVGDVLTFYQDNQARESRLLTATQRKNLIALTKLLGFRPAGAAAATVTETFTLAAPPVADVTFPASTRVQTASVTAPIAFQLLADVVIPAGTSPPTATVRALVAAYRWLRDVCSYGHVDFDPANREDPGPIWKHAILPRVLDRVFGSTAAAAIADDDAGRPCRARVQCAGLVLYAERIGRARQRAPMDRAFAVVDQPQLYWLHGVPRKAELHPGVGLINGPTGIRHVRTFALVPAKFTGCATRAMLPATPTASSRLVVVTRSSRAGPLHAVYPRRSQLADQRLDVLVEPCELVGDSRHRVIVELCAHA